MLLIPGEEVLWMETFDVSLHVTRGSRLVIANLANAEIFKVLGMHTSHVTTQQMSAIPTIVTPIAPEDRSF